MKWWILRALVLCVILLSGYAVLRKHWTSDENGRLHGSSDVLAYVDASRSIESGVDPYVDANGVATSYVYPPFLAFTFIPLTYVPPLAIDIGWFALNIFLLGLILQLGYLLFIGEPLSSAPRKDQWLLGTLSIVFSLRYIVRNAQDANINLVIVSMILVAVVMDRRKKQPWWTLLIGLTAAIKVLPLLFIVYYAGKRDWKESAWIAAGFVAGLLLPAMALGWNRNVHLLQEFSAYTQLQFSTQGLEVENFSFWGLFGRLMTHATAFIDSNGRAVSIGFFDLDMVTIRYAVLILNILFVVLVYRISRIERNTGMLRNGASVVTVLAMYLTSILIEDHHTVGFILAYLYLLIAWKQGKLEFLPWGLILIATGAVSLLATFDLVVPVFGKYAYMLLLSYSIPVLPVGIVLLILSILAFRRVDTAPGASRI